MGSGATAKYALPYPLDTDPPNIPGDVQALAAAIDAILAPWAQDIAVNRPAVGKTGRTFTQTDGLAGTTWRDSGAEWRALGSRVQANAAGDVAQVIRGFAGQTADLAQWQDSAGNVMARFDLNGSLQVGNPGAQNQIAINTGWINSTSLGVKPGLSSRIGAVIQGEAGQTASLQEWQDSTGGVVAKVRNDGLMAVPFVTNTADTGPYFQFNSTYISLNSRGGGGSPLFFIDNTNGGSASAVVQAIRGQSGQSADLQEWQNSAGLKTASIQANGVIRAWSGAVIRSDSGVGNGVPFMVQGANAGWALAQFQGATGQTADLSQWQNDVGSVLAKVDNAGNFYSNSLRSSDAPGGAFLALNSNIVQVIQQAAASVAFFVRGATSQSADLQQWQDSSGSALASISNVGTVVALQSLFVADRAANGYGVLASMSNAASVPFTAKGATGQSVSLQEWQNSAGTKLATVKQDGTITASYFDTVSGSSVGFATPSPTSAIGFQFTSRTATATPLVATGAASQTADIFQVQNSGGTPYVRVSNGGDIQQVNGGAFITGQGAGWYGANVSILTSDTSWAAIVARGKAGQTADLQQWQNSAGTKIASVDAGGTVHSGGAYLNGVNGFPAVFAPATGAAVVAAIVQGAASQTADLQQWQNSAGTVMTKINSIGQFLGAYGIGAGLGTAGASLLVPVSGTSPAIAGAEGSISSLIADFWDSSGNTGRRDSVMRLVHNGAYDATAVPRRVGIRMAMDESTTATAQKSTFIGTRADDNYANTTYGEWVVYQSGGSSYGYTFESTGHFTCGSLTQSSDIRSKAQESIRHLKDGEALAIIRGAKAQRWKYRHHGGDGRPEYLDDREHIFPMADDLPDHMLSVIPGFLGDPDEANPHAGMKAVDLRDAVGVLWHGVGELDGRLAKVERALAGR